MATASVVTAQRARNRRIRPGARRGIAGQALVLFVVLLGVLALGLTLLFNSGQVVDKKVRLTHAADAAAYSVAVQQARIFNFAAYMNRARVANEVAIAQMVSLWSWSNMLHAHTVVGYNLFTYLSPIPVIGWVATALARVYQVAERLMAAARTGVNGLANVVITGADEANGAYENATKLVLNIGAAATFLADNIVQRNDPTARIPALAKAYLASQLAGARPTRNGTWLREYEMPRSGRTAGHDRFRNVVMASRDRFSADRYDDMGIPLIDIEGNGGTDLVDYNRWVGMDTLDLEIDILFVIEIDVPLGFGGAQAVRNRQGNGQAFWPGIRSGGRTQRGNGWYAEYHGNRNYAQYNGVSRNSLSGRGASNYPSVNAPAYMPFWTPMRPTNNGLNRRRDAYFTGYEGLRDYADVTNGKAQRPEGDDAGPRFSVFVESDRANARTAEDVPGLGGRNGGRLELRSQMNDNKMTAIASAQTYFNRAPQDRDNLFRRMVPGSWNGNPANDGQLEHGNLFSPYWQARLVDTPNATYLAVGAAQLL